MLETVFDGDSDVGLESQNANYKWFNTGKIMVLVQTCALLGIGLGTHTLPKNLLYLLHPLVFV
jgi:hypothetical protein